MKLWKKIVLGLLGALVLLQIPFIYHRWQTGNLAEKISSFKTKREVNPEFIDYKGIIHAHTFIGGHSLGTFDELLSGAEKNRLDFVVMTEHYANAYDTSALTLRGFYNKTLFVSGTETDSSESDRFLIVEGFPELSRVNKFKTKEFLSEVRARNRLAFVTYPEKFNAWNEKIDGIEVFSLHTNAKQMNPVSFLLDALWSYWSYPELTLAKYFERPEKNLQKFDELTKTERLTLFAGSDAHSNIGFHIFGDSANKKLINFKFDDYETIFRTIRTHLLISKDKVFNRESLLEVLKNGNAYIGVDILGDPAGFSFTAENSAGDRKIMGEEINSGEGEIEFQASAPQASRFLLFRNGERIFESGETEKISFKTREKGAYRVEVYLDQLGPPFDKMPWIMANPIYVR